MNQLGKIQQLRVSSDISPTMILKLANHWIPRDILASSQSWATPWSWGPSGNLHCCMQTFALIPPR
jgi:hypothetical protein